MRYLDHRNKPFAIWIVSLTVVTVFAGLAGWQIRQNRQQKQVPRLLRAGQQLLPPSPQAAALESLLAKQRQGNTLQLAQPQQTVRPAKDIDEQRERMDQPGEAQEFFLQKRLPKGENTFSATRYVEALEQIKGMEWFSTAENRLIGTEELRQQKSRLVNLPSWTPLGPGNIGGRTRALVIHPTQTNTMYAAGVSGGVWKTTDGGASWVPLSDLLANIAITVLAMDPANPNVIYAGTGEGFNNADAVRGAGIFKTNDGGTNWSLLPGTANHAGFYYVNDLVVSALNAQRLYAATSQGIFRSTDGGNNWMLVHQPSTSGGALLGCHDLALRTANVSGDYLLAACGNFNQATIFLKQEAENAGAWTAVKTESGMGRTSLAFAPSNQSVVYALSSEIINFVGISYYHALHAVYRSTDGGLTWTTQRDASGTPSINTLIMSYLEDNCVANNPSRKGQGWYDNVIAVDPTDSNRVWVGGISLFRSDDGGVNWGFAGNNVHPDQHRIVFHPNYDGISNQMMFVGNDGGIFKTTNARSFVGTQTPLPGNCTTGASGVSWVPLNNGYEVTQFYHGLPYPNGTTYFGGTQDNGTVRGTNGAGRNGWTYIRGGDGGYVAIDPNNTDVMYSETTNLSFAKTTNGSAANPLWTPAINGITESPSNFLFITPFVMDPNNSQRLWIGGRTIWRTTDGAANWTQASTNNLVFPGSVSALAVAPSDSNIAMAGSSTGGIYRTSTALTNTAGSVWTNNSPRSGYVSWLAFDPYNPNVVYATYSTFGGAHIWKSFDGGANWSSIDGTGNSGIPDVPVHTLAVHPGDTNRLYVGTDIGVFVSVDGGATWARENTGFANVVTESLTILGNGCNAVVYAFTHGRGVWKVPAADCGGCPTLSGVSPMTGTIGSSITLTGTNLAGSTVKFSNNLSATITANGSSQLTVTVPAGAVTGPITISKPGCLDVQSANFIVPGTPACPAVSGLTPLSGSPGSTATITGADFTGVTAVQFSNNVNAAFTVVSNTQITATVPGGATNGFITLYKPGCNPATSESFSILAPGCATVSNIAPASGEVGSEVVITGTNLTNVSDVRFSNNLSAQFFINSSTSIVAYVPGGAASGPITLKMANCSDVQTSGFSIIAGGSWATTAGPESGQVNSLLSVPGALLATTLNGGIYRSTTNGVSWSASGTGVPSNSQTYALGTNNEAIFVAAQYGVYRSLDNGVTWTEANSGLTYLDHGATYIIGVNCFAASGSTIFAGTRDKGVYRSTDNGLTWTQVTNGMGEQQIASLLVNGTNIFAGTYNHGIFRSTDSGNSWTAINNGLGNPYAVYSLVANSSYVFAGTYGQGVYRSSDNGNNWESVNTGLSRLSISSLALNGATLLAGTIDSGAFRSTDNGSSWTSATNGLGNIGIFTLTSNGTQVVAGTNRGVFITSDNGTNWAKNNSGLKAPEMSDLVVHGTTLFATVFGDGIYRSTDSGATWLPSNTGLGDLNVYDIETTGTALLAATNSGVYRSADNGLNWTLTNNGLGITFISQFGVSGNTIFAASYLATGVYRSTDNGLSWTPANNGIAGQAIESFTANGTSMFAGTTNGGIFRTTDNGTTWTPVNNGLSNPFQRVRGLGVNGNALFAAISYNGIYRSTDNGDTWVPVNNGLGCLFPSSFAVQGGTIFAGTRGGGIYRSINNGANWISYSSGLTKTIVDMLAIQGGNLFAGIAGQAVMIRTNAVPAGCPTVSAVTPALGGTGQAIVIVGSNFTGVNAVKFNNNIGTNFTVLGDTQIVATVPAGAITGTITLSKPSCADVATSSFTVVACPTISGISPANGPVGSTITISGANFTGLNSVKFSDNISANFTVNSDGQITVTVPVGAVTGSLKLEKSGCFTTSTGRFTIPGTFACPTALSISPTTANVGGNVVITGADLTGVSSVKFSNNVNANFTINNDSTITTTVPANAVTGPLTLNTVNCSSVLTQTFTAIGCPTITSMSATSGFIGSQIVLEGTGLAGVTFVKFNNNTLSASFGVTNNSLIVTVPVGAMTGPITLVKPGCPDVQTELYTINSGGGWAQTGGPSGATIYDLLVAGGNVFATTSNGIYRSTNEGVNWSFAGNGFGQGANAQLALSLAVSGTNLFAGSAYYGVYRSSDQGQSWSRTSNGLGGTLGGQSVRALAVNGATIFAGMNYLGIYRSTDEGENWGAVNTGFGNQTAMSLFANGGAIFAGTEANGAYRSLDNGATWTQISSIPTNQWVYDFTVNGTTLFAAVSNGIYRSTDNGMNWNQVLAGNFESIRVANSTIFAGTTNLGIRSSSDNGNSWITINNGIGNVTVKALAVSATNVFAGTSGTVFRSSDNGTNWSPTDKGLIAQVVPALAAIGSTTFAATSANGIYRSTDGGVSWTAINNSLGTGYFNYDLRVSGTALLVGTNNGVFRSTDNGNNWTGINNGFSFSKTVYSLAASGNTLLAGLAFNGVYLSTDNGGNWSAINNNGIGLQTVNAVAISGSTLFAGVGDYPGTTTKGIYRSTDNGASWNLVLSNVSPWSLTVSGNAIYAAATQGIYRSLDNGSTWTQLHNLLFQKIVASDNTLFAGGPGGVYRSTNNGAGWTEFNVGLSNTDVQSLLLQGDKLFAGTNGSSVFVRLNNLNCPIITNLNPTSGVAGSTVTLTGTDLSGVTGVKFSNNLSADILSNTSTQLTVKVPVGAVTGPLVISRTSCDDYVTPSFTVCSLALSSGLQGFTAGGGTGSVNLTASTGSCPWLATSSQPWVTITSATSGAGNGSISFTVASYTGANARSADILISGQKLTIIQLGTNANADTDGDQVPDAIELAEGRNVFAKDNDVFTGNSTGNRQFVMQQYRDFLGREGDAPGIQGWGDLLSNNSLSRAQVIQSFFNSPEFQQYGAPIVRLYLAYFRRIPDYAGQLGWTNVLRNGTSLDAISQTFATSPEFQLTYGALSNSQFITLVYQNVLNRTPSQTEIDAWVALLNQGAPRGQVMAGFSESQEFKQQAANKVFVIMMYVGMLRREPEQAGYDGWVALLNSGISQLVLTQSFLDAQEYHNRFLP